MNRGLRHLNQNSHLETLYDGTEKLKTLPLTFIAGANLLKRFSEKMDTFSYKLVVSLFVLPSIAIFQDHCLYQVNYGFCYYLKFFFLKCPTNEISREDALWISIITEVKPLRSWMNFE